MTADGVVVKACIVCADSYGVTESLRGLGIEEKAMGQKITQTFKDGYKVQTFSCCLWAHSAYLGSGGA